MASPPIVIASLILIFANLVPLEASSSDDHFLKCLTNQFHRLKSHTDLIVTPQNATYASLMLAQNLLPAALSRSKPHLIITPHHASEIQAAVRCSKKLGLQIRVRSGGHDYEGLSYASPNPSIRFVVIDMRNLHSVTVDKKRKTAWVQVGATLGQFYYAISKKSKTLGFPAGTCPTVGVAGHFSGGGYSMMTRKHSIAADHIIDAKLINADGKILNRKTMGKDLFWAIRGGGGTSFGIILEFKVKLVTVPKKVTIFNVRRTSEHKVTALVNRWQHIADKIDDDVEIITLVQSQKSWETGKKTIAANFTALYLGRADGLLRIMKEKFPELGVSKQDCMEMSWIDNIMHLAGFANQPYEALTGRTPLGYFKRQYFKGKSDYVSTPIPKSGLRHMWKFIIEDDLGLLIMVPYGGVMNTISESETPFPHRRGVRFHIHYSVSWTNQNETPSHIDWIRRFYSFMTPYVTKSPRTAYFNYRDLDIGRNNEGNTTYEQASVWGFTYFKNNFERLVRVKTKIDPSNFFRNEQSIPPRTL